MNELLMKLAGKIKAIARGLGNAGILDADDNEQNIQIGIMNAYTKQPTATESYLLEAGRNYARDILKTERAREGRRLGHIDTDSEGAEIDALDQQIPHPNRKGRDAEVIDFCEELKNVLTYKQIVILDLVIFDGYTLPEIAEMIKWNLRTVQREAVVIRNEGQNIGHHFFDHYEPIRAKRELSPKVFRGVQLMFNF